MDVTRLSPPPRRILRVLTRLNIGGPSLHAALLSTRLETTRFSTCVVMGQPDASEGDLSELMRGPSVRLIRLRTLQRAIRPWSDLRAFVELLRIVWRERPQLIHTHMAKAGALGRVAGACYNRFGPGRRPGARAILVHTFHGHVLDGYFSPSRSRFFVRIERWLARRTDRLIAVSPRIRDELLAKGIGRAAQWTVVPLGLDLSRLASLPLPNEASQLRLGMVSRLVPIKNPGLFLEAFARLAQRDPARPVAGLIVGDGPLRGPLEREVDRLGLTRIVRFTGWQDDLRSVYQELEIACLTSWNEGTPVSLIEAMAAGRAIVATDVGGVRDLLEASDEPASVPIAAGEYRIAHRGLIVRPGDPDGLVAALEALASDAVLRRTLGEAARAHALQAFHQERLLQDITLLYDQLLTEAQ